MAGTEPIPVRCGNTGWRTLRSSFALGSIENVVIVTESCEMTVSIFSFRGQVLSVFQHFLRIYGFEGGAAEEGEDVTRIRESSYRRHALSCLYSL